MHGKRMEKRGISKYMGNMSGRFKKYLCTTVMAALILMFGVLGSVVLGRSGVASAVSSSKATLKYEGLSAEVMLGNTGEAKMSKNIPVTVKLTNDGDDFSGIIRVRFDSSYSDRKDAMIEQVFDIAAGQSKTVQMLLLPTYVQTSDQLVELCDEDGDVLEDSKIGCKFNENNESIFVGVLSDDASGFGYMKNVFVASAEAAEEEVFDDEDAYVDDETVPDNEAMTDGGTVTGWEGSYFELTEDDINDDAEYLDMYDIIIIDNFDTSILREEQKKAILSWVRDGGLLLLSTGGNPDKVLKGFDGGNEFKVDISGTSKTVKTSFGMTKEDIIQYSGSQGYTEPIESVISNLVLDGKNKTVLKDENGELLQSKKLGQGTVMVSEFSLSLPQKVWNTYGGAFLYILGRNLGSHYFYDNTLNSSTNSSYYYGIYGVDSLPTALNRNESKSLPNLALYTFLLLAYAVIAGPILYFVLRKKDRNTLLWGAIPVTAVVFSLLIYIIGSSTRIQRPYIKYLSEISFDGLDAENLNMNTQFTVTSPSNKSYSVDVKKDMYVSPEFSENGVTGINTGEGRGYVYGVHREGESQKLDLASVSAFSDMLYKSKQKVSAGGGIETDIKEVKGKPKGVITNNTKYTFENCFLCYNMELYYWEEIPAGESVSVEDAKYYPNNYKIQTVYEEGKDEAIYDFDSLMEDITLGIYKSYGYSDNYDFVSDNRAARQMAMVSDNIYSTYFSTGQIKSFYGFFKEGDDDELFPAAFDGMENYGVTAVSRTCG